MTHEPSPQIGLFIYGTLAPGQENHWVLANVLGRWQSATTRGTVLPQGTESTYGYPAFLADGQEQVHGWLFTSAELSAHWPRLDDFEGDGYVRQRIQVIDQRGRTIPAYVYGARTAQAQVDG